MRFVEEGDILVLQNEISNLMYLIKQAVMRGMKIVLNSSLFEEVLKEIELQDLFFLILNETESMQWMGSENPYDILLWAKEKFSQLHVVLTLGEKGSVYLREGKLYRQQAFKANVVDTTAVGDTFTGYFVAGLCRDLGANEILKKASAASAITVSRKGGKITGL